MRRHFVSGFLRALLSLGQEKSSGVEIDCDLSSLCPAHYFTVIPLFLSEPTQHEVSREGSVAK